MKAVIAICTFERPDSLRHLLQALRTLAFDGQIEIVVADNSAALEGLAVLDTLPADYPHPTHGVDASARPGISENRNRALTRALELSPDVIACIDDDEWPEPEWLAELVRVQDTTGVSAVGGPTLPAFPVSATDAQRRNPYFGADMNLPNGAACTLQAAGNFLILPEALAGMGPEFFDSHYAHSGGEDLDFFARLEQAGHRMAWASQAIVHEPVIAARLSHNWMKARIINIHSTRVRIMQKLEPGFGASLVRSVKTAGLGAVSLLYTVVGLFSRPLAEEARLLRWKFLGKLAGHRGSERRRTETS